MEMTSGSRASNRYQARPKWWLETGNPTGSRSRVGLDPILFLFSLYIKGWAKSKKIGCGCLYSKFTCSDARMIRKIGVAMWWMFVVKD